MASTVTELLRRRFGGKTLPYDAEIEYLESTGTQYINTGITPDANTGLQCTAFGINTDNFMAGLKDTASGNTRWAIGNSGNNRYYYGYGTSSSILTIEQNVIALIGLNFLNSKVFKISKVDGTSETSRSLPSLGFTPQNQIRIFGSSGVVASYTTWSGKMYSAKISQNSDVIMDLIPVRKGTTGYMYDKVSGQLFGNAGTGNFILGPDKYGIIYNASNVTYDGTNNTDTGIYLMDGENFKITINYQPTATSGKFIACRNPGTLKGFDLRISNGKIDFVRDNSDIYLSNVSVGDTINLTITKIGSTITVTDGVLSGSGIVTDTDKTLFIGSDCNGQGKSQFILNNITVERFK